MALLIVVGVGLAIAGTVRILEWVYDRGLKRSLDSLITRIQEGDPDLGD